MVRVSNLDASHRFYCDALGLREVRRFDNEKGRYTLVFVAAPGGDTRRGRSALVPSVVRARQASAELHAA